MVRSRPGRCDTRLAHRHRFGRQARGLEMVIEQFVLAKDDRVINGHRLQQHAVSVLHRGRCHHDQSRIMRVNRLHALTVKRAAPGSSARGQSHGDRAGNIRSPIERGGVIEDLIQARRRKIGKLHFDNRTQPFDGRADGRADHGVLADRGVEHAAGKFHRQIFGRLECAAESPNVLAVDKNTRIVRQRPGLGFANGFEVGDAHGLAAESGVSNRSLKWREASAHQFSLLISGPGSRCTRATACSTASAASSRNFRMPAASAQPRRSI